MKRLKIEKMMRSTLARVAPSGSGDVVPELVVFEENGKDARSVDYARLTALLIEAVKEQQAQIREWKSQIARLTGRGNIELASRQ